MRKTIIKKRFYGRSIFFTVGIVVVIFFMVIMNRFGDDAILVFFSKWITAISILVFISFIIKDLLTSYGWCISENNEILYFKRSFKPEVQIHINEIGYLEYSVIHDHDSTIYSLGVVLKDNSKIEFVKRIGFGLDSLAEKLVNILGIELRKSN